MPIVSFIHPKIEVPQLNSERLQEILLNTIGLSKNIDAAVTNTQTQ